MDDDLELSVVDVYDHALLAFESHVVGFIEFVLGEAGDNVCLAHFLCPLS